MASPVSSTTARPPETWTQWSSMKLIFCIGSSSRETTTTGRMAVSSAASVARAARCAERTEENVATARTNVPTAVAAAAGADTQSVTSRSGRQSGKGAGHQVDAGGQIRPLLLIEDAEGAAAQLVGVRV